jgi:hypothetical protein
MAPASSVIRVRSACMEPLHLRKAGFVGPLIGSFHAATVTSVQKCGREHVSELVQGKAGQLSLLTTLLLFIGTVVRIFTSMRESSGAAMVRGFILGAAVNGLMLFQILYFGKDGRLVQPQKAHTKARAKKVQ